MSHPRLRVPAGDAQNPDAIEKLLEGQEVVCDCLGITNVVRTITMFSRCAENLSKALKPEQLLLRSQVWRPAIAEDMDASCTTMCSAGRSAQDILYRSWPLRFQYFGQKPAPKVLIVVALKGDLHLFFQGEVSNAVRSGPGSKDGSQILYL